MLEFIKQLDVELLLAINGLNTSFLDGFMVFITNRYTWIPLYLLIVFFLFLKKRNVFLMGTLFLIAAVVSSDQFASAFMKPLFERLRPCHNTSINHLLHSVNNICGGKYGFISSHAANTFSLAIFLFLWLKNEYRWLWLFFIWALIVSLSRVYLGVHYPSDVLVGALSGLIIGTLFFYLFRYFTRKIMVDKL